MQSPTDMSSELSTVTTAASASPHLDLTMSILPGGREGVHQGSTLVNQGKCGLWDPEPGRLSQTPRSPGRCQGGEEALALG